MKMRLTESQLTNIIRKATSRIINEGMYELETSHTNNVMFVPDNYSDDDNNSIDFDGQDEPFEYEGPNSNCDELDDNQETIWEKYNRVMNKQNRLNEEVEQASLLTFVTNKWNAPANRLLK